MRKSPKNLPEGVTPSGYSPWGALSSPQQHGALLPPRKGCNSGLHASHKATAAPRIDSRECDSRCSLGRKKDRFAHQLKVANRFIFVAEALSRGLRRRRRGSEASPLGDSKGRSLWRAFGDFPRVGKVTRGGGAERPPQRGCWGRRPPLRGAQRGAPEVRPLAKRFSTSPCKSAPFPI